MDHTRSEDGLHCSESEQDREDSETAKRPKGRRRRIRAIVFVVAHLLGAVTSVQAIMSTRTAQAAAAWAISLNTVPYVAVPAYWIFGRSKFDGYQMRRHSNMLKESTIEKKAIRRLRQYQSGNRICACPVLHHSRRCFEQSNHCRSRFLRLARYGRKNR